MEFPQRMYEILTKVSGQFRKGSEVTHNGKPVTVEDLAERLKNHEGGVFEVFDMPPVEAAKQDGSVEMVDCHFLVIGVHKEEAKKHEKELRFMLEEWPQDREVSYLEAGAWCGSQDLAFMLFAVGEVLGFWKVQTPDRMLGNTVPNELKDVLAGRGYITVSEFKKAA
jgi:hypothetical protein